MQRKLQMRLEIRTHQGKKKALLIIAVKEKPDEVVYLAVTYSCEVLGLQILSRVEVSPQQLETFLLAAQGDGLPLSDPTEPEMWDGDTARQRYEELQAEPEDEALEALYAGNLLGLHTKPQA